MDLLGAAVVVVLVILVAVGVVRAIRDRPPHSTQFGAGGRTTIPVGTRGLVKSAIDPSGIVTAVGEDWSARSRSGSPIPEGASVTVTGQDGLTIIVEPASTTSSTQG